MSSYELRQKITNTKKTERRRYRKKKKYTSTKINLDELRHKDKKTKRRKDNKDKNKERQEDRNKNATFISNDQMILFTEK